jgi:hypothetical protein
MPSHHHDPPPPPRPKIKYRGSPEERADLLRHYAECGGDMAKVFEWVMLSRPELDAHRFMAVLDDAIDKGEGAVGLLWSLVGC